jgi:hypothetical protein
MLNRNGGSCSAALGRQPSVIAARGRSDRRLSWRRCPAAFDQNFFLPAVTLVLHQTKQRCRAI